MPADSEQTNNTKFLYVFMVASMSGMSSKVWTPTGSRDNCIQQQHCQKRCATPPYPAPGAGEIPPSYAP